MSAKPRVLIAEVSQEIRVLESAIAAHCGCDVTLASDGGETLRFLESREFDAMLLGSPIATGGGTNVLNLLERHFRHFAPRTIVVTTHVEDIPLLCAAARAKVFAVVAKPFDVAVLAAVIAECLRNEGSADTVWIGVPTQVIEEVWMAKDTAEAC